MRFSLQGRLLTIAGLAVIGAVISVYVISSITGDHLLGLLSGLIVGLGSAWALVGLLARPLKRGIEAIGHGMHNLEGKDFSTTLAPSGLAELDIIIARYNNLSEQLRRDRQTIFQRELLLDTVIENSSMCVLIADHTDRIIYSNHVAEHLLRNGRAMNGLALDNLLRDHSHTLAELVEREQSGIFRLQDDCNGRLHHLSCGHFVLNAQRHRLILIKEMTREINRQEAATWKEIIRVISHELNNSLAPISSMAHSGRLLLDKGLYDALPDVFNTLAERTRHLTNFVGRYAEIAKLPLPDKTAVDWQEFCRGLAVGYPFTLTGSLPSPPGYFDVGQLQQVLLNLLKNAVESGSEANQIKLTIIQDRTVSVIEVSDRGTGMSSKVMQRALLPFYTTKPSGSGVGLTLCREIVEAHDGQLSFANRAGGGLNVRIVLPLPVDIS